MSLINDALKRAQQVQHQSPPPSTASTHLRPIEPQQRIRHSVGFALPIAFALVALCVLFFVWEMAQKSKPTTPADFVAQATTPANPVPSPSPNNPPTVQSTPLSQAAVPIVPPEPTNTTALGSPESGQSAPEQVPAPPKPAPLRLQALVWNPARPSAIVNGKTLFIGDKFGDMRVAVIDQQSITLAGGGHTNVLTLEQ